MSHPDLFGSGSISSPPDTLASHLAIRDCEEAKKILATSFRTSCGLLHKRDPLGAFSRMFMDTSRWAWTQYSMQWQPKATPAGRLLFQLQVSARGIRESGSGLWATPRTTDVTGGARTLGEDGRRVSKSNPSQTYGANLADQVLMWPTPRASEWKDCGEVGSKSHSHMMDKEYLCAGVKDPAQPNGRLNPDWTEWLMGYPIGWTELKD